MTTVESRVGALEGRADEQAAAIAALREDIRELGDRLDRRIDQLDVRLNQRFDQVNVRMDQVNARIDRMFLGMLTVGAAIVVAHAGILVTVILRT